jgi:hypothetical protein
LVFTFSREASVAFWGAVVSFRQLFNSPSQMSIFLDWRPSRFPCFLDCRPFFLAWYTYI